MANNIFPKTGNVGIGTRTPQRKLEISHEVAGISFEGYSASPNAGAIRFGDNSGWKLHFGRSRDKVNGPLNSSVSGVLMTIQDNGNVGIGTTSPQALLDVRGALHVEGNVRAGPVTAPSITAGTVFVTGKLVIGSLTIDEYIVQRIESYKAG